MLIQVRPLQKSFDYKGFESRGKYYKNAVKNFLGKGKSKQEQLSELEKLNQYYKDHPNAVKNVGKKETAGSIDRKLRSNNKDKINKLSEKFDREIKKTGTKFKPGKIQKVSRAIAIGLQPVPVPLTSTIGGAIAVAGEVAGNAHDNRQIEKLGKINPKVTEAHRDKQILVHRIKVDSNYLHKKGKLIRQNESRLKRTDQRFERKLNKLNAKKAHIQASRSKALTATKNQFIAREINLERNRLSRLAIKTSRINKKKK